MGSCRPRRFSSPQTKQWCGSTTKRYVRPSSGGVMGAGLDDPRWAAVAASDVKVGHLARLGLDEVAARADLLAHELAEDEVGLGGGVDLGAQQRARGRGHSRF